MKSKRFWLVRPIYALLILLSAGLLAVLFFISPDAFWISMPIALVIIGLSIYRLIKIQDDLRKMLSAFGSSLVNSHDANLINFPIPTVILSGGGEIIWYNDNFKKTVIESQDDVFGYNIKSVTGRSLSELLAGQDMIIDCENKHYRCFCTQNKNRDDTVYLIYMIDVTNLVDTKAMFENKKPAVLIALVDNYDDSIGNSNEGNSARLIGDVQRVLQEFTDNSDGFLKKLSHDRYLIIMEKQSLEKVIAGRFSVLDKVREIETENTIPITLSLGVAVAEVSLSAAEQSSRQALEMALGRGGDQAAIKTEGGYEFFGGYSKGVEKRTKVKTRMVASAMRDMIEAADNVLVMGHRFADLDCIGAAIGIAKACECLGKEVNIAVDPYKNLASDLIEHYTKSGKKGVMVHPDIAYERITAKTLLIIVDTHGTNLLESIDIYKKCKQTIVIDHHRKLVDHIDDAVIFYHEPYASSASEMVTELVQYFGDKVKVSQVEAEALLAGIMLDTRNFVLRTGVRTFEAAAYLRRMGADTVAVKEFFASTMDSYQERTQVVSSAEIYKECAIAICDMDGVNLRIVAPQAADELLNISGVKASFVLYEKDDVIYISARSMGAYNMQIMMEEMGGGGHHTMAAAQVPNITIDKARQTLLEIIDKQTQYAQEPKI